MDREELERRHKHRSERHAQLAERYKHDTLLAMTADEAFQADETVLALLSHIRELEAQKEMKALLKYFRERERNANSMQHGHHASAYLAESDAYEDCADRLEQALKDIS